MGWKGLTNMMSPSGTVAERPQGGPSMHRADRGESLLDGGSNRRSLSQRAQRLHRGHGVRTDGEIERRMRERLRKEGLDGGRVPSPAVRVRTRQPAGWGHPASN